MKIAMLLIPMNNIQSQHPVIKIFLFIFSRFNNFLCIFNDIFLILLKRGYKRYDHAWKDDISIDYACILAIIYAMPMRKHKRTPLASAYR